MEENTDLLKCRKCKSTQITDSKKGFSAGKAAAGAILTGGIGLLAGTIGSGKIILTCLSCGHKFKIGEDLKSIEVKRKQEKEAFKNPKFWLFLAVFFLPFIWLISKCT